MKQTRSGVLCGVYLAAMGSLFLLAFLPGGYLQITAAKRVVFYSLTGLLLAGLVLCALVFRDKPLRKPGAAQYLVCAYWLCSLLSALCSPWPEIAYLGGQRDDGLLSVSLYCALFLALSLYAKPDKRLLWVFAAALTVHCAVCFLQLADRNPLGLYPEPLRWSGRETVYNGAFLGLTGNADLSAAVLCLGFPACWVYGLRARKPLFFLPAALCLAVLLLAGMRGGLLGAVLGSCCALPWALPLGRRGRLRLLAGLAASLLLLLAAVYFLPGSGLWHEAHTVLHGQLTDTLGSGRVYIWRNTLALLPDRLLLGGGPDTLGQRMTAVFTRVLPDGTVLTREIDCAHNEYLNMLLNQGLPALLAYLGALVCSLTGFLQQNSTAAAVTGSAVLCYLIQAFFGIAMPANAALYWCMWGLLEAARLDQTMARSFHLPLR